MTREEVLIFLNKPNPNAVTMQNFFVKFAIYKNKSLPQAILFIDKLFKRKDIGVLLNVMLLSVINEFHINRIYLNGKLIRYY